MKIPENSNKIAKIYAQSGGTLINETLLNCALALSFNNLLSSNKRIISPPNTISFMITSETILVAKIRSIFLTTVQLVLPSNKSLTFLQRQQKPQDILYLHMLCITTLWTTHSYSHRTPLVSHTRSKMVGKMEWWACNKFSSGNRIHTNLDRSGIKMENRSFECSKHPMLWTMQFGLFGMSFYWLTTIVIGHWCHPWNKTWRNTMHHTINPRNSRIQNIHFNWHHLSWTISFYSQNDRQTQHNLELRQPKKWGFTVAWQQLSCSSKFDAPHKPALLWWPSRLSLYIYAWYTWLNFSHAPHAEFPWQITLA